ncbi:MAG: hypothetical protein KF718_33735, partial [Polyangiaceae bacterium]|nr:hypothetical protein [Polyangiaceae bacterium]
KTGGGGTGGGGSIGDASVDEGTPFAGGDNACNSCASTDCFPALAECGANFDCNACNTGMFSADCDAPNSPLFQDLVNCACTSPGACTGDCDCALALSLMIGGGE